MRTAKEAQGLGLRVEGSVLMAQWTPKLSITFRGETQSLDCATRRSPATRTESRVTSPCISTKSHASSDLTIER